MGIGRMHASWFCPGMSGLGVLTRRRIWLRTASPTLLWTLQAHDLVN
jgi:hypothetical protein